MKNKLYFDTLCKEIDMFMPAKKNMSKKYKKLLRLLYSIPFEYTNELDGNRIADAEDYRFTFEDEGYPIIGEMDYSVLEVLVAFVIRVETSIMADFNFGDRTGYWFWNIIFNLGLENQTDNNFDEEYCRNVIDIALKREYRKDGTGGGMFPIPGFKKDLRKHDIWKQMLWWLNANDY